MNILFVEQKNKSNDTNCHKSNREFTKHVSCIFGNLDVVKEKSKTSQ